MSNSQITSTLLFFPPSFMHDGMKVKIKRYFDPFDEEIWLTVTEFNGIQASGIGYEPNRISSYQKVFQFYYSEIMGVKSDMSWNIDHMYVFCSINILKGERVSYIVGHHIEFPLDYGLAFLSESDLRKKKDQIVYAIVLLQTLLQLDKSVLPYLEEEDYFFGWLRDSEEEYQKLEENDKSMIDSKKFPYLYDQLHIEYPSF